MKWTTPADIRRQVQKLWDKGLLLATLADDESIFPRRIPLKGPGSAEMAERFAEVRSWISDLDQHVGHYRLEWRTVNHRTLGANSIPAAIWIDTLEDALKLIGRQQDANIFAGIIAMSRAAQPQLITWLAKRPLRGLALADSWQHLLAVVAWLKAHPHPQIYLRQVDIPGVHSKFIESHRGVLAELLDLTLAPDAIDERETGVAGFCKRYGFLDKPSRIRFRLLDPSTTLIGRENAQDITLTDQAFSTLDLTVKHVFITENEINFLAFPRARNSMVIFGAGYGFAMLAEAHWLQSRKIHYWGDIDTHGFAILDQLRAYLRQVSSFLMDKETFLAHREHWDREPQPQARELTRLTSAEQELYDELCTNRLGTHLRLEQERIRFNRVLDMAAKLSAQ
ncbi:DUF3322 domain-containing protein [Desulfopila aestuarii]|uniref:Wadjet protein JetD C-terminal domain-containing protein n=1 Tax=Desulfopila aestuarii DSM 18488 TaxID=1121416 RepID=A0A1M7YJ71_9BACT|nr:DUF3322 domain-containing protein [Desulfopila aestuarii]SHO52659.1 hypothetical protein SAMN02745220_04674 [Desulfopila aestuarii DSM 18488]